MTDSAPYASDIEFYLRNRIRNYDEVVVGLVFEVKNTYDNWGNGKALNGHIIYTTIVADMKAAGVDNHFELEYWEAQDTETRRNVSQDLFLYRGIRTVIDVAFAEVD